MESILPPIVQWYEGMPLLAHHFQQMTLRQESLSSISIALKGDYYYGILSMDVDKSALLSNVLRVTKLKCIFPNGTYVDSTQIQELNIEYSLGTESKGTLELFLVFPKIFENNFVSGTHPRYISTTRSGITDINTSQEPIQCLSLVPNVKLEKKDFLSHAFYKIKAFELKLNDGVWEIINFSAPCLFVEKDSFIHNMCSDICLSMRKKLYHIGEEIKNSGQNKSFSYFSENMFLILGLGTFLPQIEALLINHQSHPYDLYMSMCSILGSMSLMSDSMTPPLVPKYKHEDLNKTFEELKTIIELLLTRAVNEKYTTVSFVEEEGRYGIKVFSGDIKRDYILIGLKKSHGVSDKDSKKWLQNAVIVDINKIDQAMTNRVLGFRRTHLEKTEDILPTKDVLLFKVDFEGITKDLDNIIILNKDNLEFKPLELFVYKPKKQRQQEEIKPENKSQDLTADVLIQENKSESDPEKPISETIGE